MYVGNQSAFKNVLPERRSPVALAQGVLLICQRRKNRVVFVCGSGSGETNDGQENGNPSDATHAW